MQDMQDVFGATSELPILIAKYEDTLNPGGSAVAKIQYRKNDGTLADSGQKRYINDELYQNYILPDESSYVRFDTSRGEFVAVGTWGLERTAKPGAEITAGSSGSFTIWEGTGALAATSSTVTAYHDWIDGLGNIPSGTECSLKYYPTHQKWRVMDFDCF